MDRIAYKDKYPATIWKAFLLLLYITLIKTIIELGVGFMSGAYIGIYTAITGQNFDTMIAESTNIMNLSAVTISDFVLISILLYMTRKRRIEPIQFKKALRNKPNVRIALFSILGVFFVSLVGGLVTQGLSTLFQAEIPEQIEAMMQVDIVFNLETVLTVLAVVIAAPLFEEFLLRKIMMDGLLRNNSPMVAIITSAVFFAVFHMNIVQGVYTVFLGLYLAYLYYKTGSLWLVTVIHAVNNLYAVLVRAVPESVANPISLVLLVGGICSLFLLHKELKTGSVEWITLEEPVEEEPQDESPVSLQKEVVLEKE